MTKRNVRWQVDGIVANAVSGAENPTFQRGATETYEFEFYEDGYESTTFSLGGQRGAALGGEAGGTLSDEPYDTPSQRLAELRQLVEYAGTNAFGTTLDGEVYIREYLTENAPVESRIVRVIPSTELRDMPAFWAAVENGDDTSRSPGRNTLSLDFVYLARSNEYATRTDLLDDLSTPITQL
ncbi:hypothetical protein HrrHc1_125 [Halorubrum phage Hardycor1]|nr:hypothetical protein HrrHc1_125 [Halorubrum phage Hardycor1]